MVDRPCDPSTFADGLPSLWGRIYGWDYTAAMLSDWWNGEHEGRWGAWPDTITSVEVVSKGRLGLTVHLNETWVAQLYPFQTGMDVSTLALFEPWTNALSSAPILLPIAGQKNERGDQVAVFEMHTCLSTDEMLRNPHDLVRAAAGVHAALVAHATPNTERRWNGRLKAIEDQLKTTTLWRAPHTKHVVGLPSTPFSLDGVVAQADGTMALIAQPRSLVDHLLAPSERLPGVSSIAMFEQRLSLVEGFDSPESRKGFYRAWGVGVPSSWTSRASLSIANGGVWIWRYEAMLLMLAEARAYGLKKQAKACDRWLFEVSRIQARLGELRTIHAVRRGGMWAAIAAALLGSGPVQIPIVLGSAGVALAAHLVHQRRMPPPF
ncbi:MAG: hypothetical protein ACPH86_04805 [Schleiferiaceae bacterium]